MKGWPRVLLLHPAADAVHIKQISTVPSGKVPVRCVFMCPDEQNLLQRGIGFNSTGGGVTKKALVRLKGFTNSHN